MVQRPDVTGLFVAWSQGDGDATERFIEAVYAELRLFGGLTGDEIAAVLGVAPITVKRDWALAKAWLFRELRGEA